MNRRRWLMPLVGGAFALAAVEVALRVAGIGYDTSMQPDGYCGWSLRPGAVHWDGGIGAFVTINRDGLRDREHERAKPAGTWRLAVLGDSFTQGREAELQDTFPRRLEPRLETCSALAGRSAEVVNFGTAGYGTAQELLQLEQRVWAYEPDAVLLAFYEGNDVADNSPDLAMDADYRPFFRFAEDGRLVADLRFRDGARYRFETTKLGSQSTRLKSRLRVWQLAGRAVEIAKIRWSHPNDAVFNDRAMGTVPGALVPPRDPKWSEAWKLTEGILLRMRDEVEGRGRRFFVFTIGAPIQVSPDAEARRAEAVELGVPDLSYPERRLVEFARENRVVLFPLVDEMRRVAERDHVHLHGIEGSGAGFHHWNRRGHALAAELLADRICERLGGEPHPQTPD